MPTRAGAGNILWALRYEQIAKWAGLKLNSVRTYANRGEFEASDIDSVLKWVNARRAKQGLPMIGIPEKNIPSDQPENPSEGVGSTETPENTGETDSSDSHPPKCPETPTTNPVATTYNPETGEYDGEA